MKKILVLLFVIAGFISCNDRSEIAVNQVPMKWEYDVPATKYWEGLPIGTGRFAAMIPGNTDTEVIAFNDETLWTGGPYNPVQEGGPEALGKLRAYALARDYVNAEKEAWKLNGHPTQLQYYQPMARVNIDYGHPLDETKNYYRSLDMDDATVNVSYQYQDVNYKRQVFASFPDQVIVFRFTADKKAKVSFSTWLTSLQPSAKTRIENGELVMEGTTISEKEGKGPSHQNKGDGWIILPPQMRWQSRIKVLNQGGTLTVDNDKLTVADADAVTIILAGATNWVNWNDVSADEKQRCDDYMRSAEKHPYPELLQRHLDDFRPLMAACRIYLGEDPHPGLTTTQVMDKIREGAIDPAYEARYFQYGRYLMLCARRGRNLF
jgi:alpha-L-fucosidase 2